MSYIKVSYFPYRWTSTFLRKGEGGKKTNPYEGYLAHSWGPESARHRFGFAKGKGIFCFRAPSLRRDRGGVNQRCITAPVHRPWSRPGKDERGWGREPARGRSTKDKAAAGYGSWSGAVCSVL